VQHGRNGRRRLLIPFHRFLSFLTSSLRSFPHIPASEALISPVRLPGSAMNRRTAGRRRAPTAPDSSSTWRLPDHTPDQPLLSRENSACSPSPVQAPQPLGLEARRDDDAWSNGDGRTPNRALAESPSPLTISPQWRGDCEVPSIADVVVAGRRSDQRYYCRRPHCPPSRAVVLLVECNTSPILPLVPGGPEGPPE
jgi:hypothetical protein